MNYRATPALLLAALAAAASGSAQPLPAPPSSARPPRSLRSAIGVEAARPLLRAESSEHRQRAFERLGATGTTNALELLARALDAGGAARDARERLVVVRSLAPYVADETARSALVRALGGADAKDDPKDLLVQNTAALALARSRVPAAVQALAQALRQPGRVSEAARAALRAYPPRGVAGLLAARGAPTAELVSLLGELGDARALELVLGLVESGAPELRARALLALFRLDRPRALELARTAGADAPAPVRVAATRVLALAAAPEAAGALAALLRDPATRAQGIDIALAAPTGPLAPILANLDVQTDDVDSVFAALGRIGGKVALARLERGLREPANGWAAAYALALARDADADDAIERALGEPKLRRDAARAAVLRHSARGRSVSGLEAALDALERSGDPSDGAAAAWCRAVLHPEAGAALLASPNPRVVSAVARAALEPALAEAAARRLPRERDPSLRAALALALALPDAGDQVPNATLIELVESRGAASYVAARALAERDTETLRPRLRELLASGDPVLRAHVALGLARSTESSAVGLLGDAYRFETEPRVRRALVTALGARREPGRARTLRLAADLDPDERVRRAARRALGRERAEPVPEGGGTAWIKTTGAASGELLVIELATGVALPAAADPDGSATFSELPPGDVEITFASPEPGLSSNRVRP